MPVGAVAGASVVGAGAQMWGASQAADAQTQAAQQAGALQQAQAAKAGKLYKQATAQSVGAINNMYGQAQGNFQPYLGFGADAGQQLMDRLPALTRRFDPTMAELEGTPGYQFTLNQGLKAAQNSYASKGLGTSGAAMKGATDYAEDLAGTTFQQQFENYKSQNEQEYNMLFNLLGQGSNAAANLGQLGLTASGQMTNAYMGGAQGQANAATNFGQAGANALTGAANAQAGMYNSWGQALGQGAMGAVSPYYMQQFGAMNAGAPMTGWDAQVTPSANYMQGVANPYMYNDPITNQWQWQ